ncbi:hypothetical protein PC128_g3713 [Phytophthora cactorum]|nr:hypothetical protein PC128_g3713 [Phytophthora cactorum]
MADGGGVSHGGVDAVEAPTEDKMATLASLVCESDDVADPKKDQTQQQGSIVAPRDSIVMPRKSGAAMSESSAPRPSVVNIVAAEVATFFDVFGLLGVPMIIMFVLSAAWTFMLAVIQVHADEMANIIMNTTDFDNGKFWLLPQPESALIVSSVVLLSLFGIGYAGLAVIMLFFYRAGGPSETNELHENATPVPKTPDNPNTFAAKSEQRGSQLQRIISWIRLKCDLPIEIRQHYYTAALDLPKLIFQTLTLFTYLENGFPTPIIYTYSVLLLCNWLVACYRSQHYVADPALVIARLYYTFDLFFAVFAPLVVLIFFIESFKFDREAFLTKTETIGAGTFDTVARLFGDPSQISSFCSAFHYLQFSSGSTLFYKSALNLLSLYKWKKIVMTLIHNRHERQLERKRKVLVGPVPSSLSRTASIKVAITKQLTASKLKFKMEKHFCSKLFLSLVFLCAGIGNFVYSIGAIVSTTDLCSKYDKCVVASYYWNFGQKYCTCLVFADRQTAPKTYAEWTDPEDTAANLAELAHAGELRIVQIINRAVPELPEELRNCEYLEQLILAYTKTEVLPEWLSEFSHLEYLHVEGDFTSRRLTTIPDGIFDGMPHLSFLHLGSIPNVEKLPSLSSLKSLRYLTLAVLDSLKEIPSFDGLSRLSDLTIINAPRAATLPSMEPLASLTTMVLRPKSAVCCNGFISGTCNMTMTQCLPVASEKYPPTCTDARISEDDKAVLATFGASICPNTVAVDREAAAPSKRTTDELCGGVNYKECVLDGVQGICYNTRMMVINCEKTSGYIAMRKLQIQLFEIGPRLLAQSSILRQQIKSQLMIVSTQGVVAVAYPLFSAVFNQLTGIEQTAFVIVMPVIKFVTKQIIADAAESLNENLGPIVVFSVDVFNVFYVAICMQAATSTVTTLLFVGADSFHVIVALRSIFRKNNAIHSKSSEPSYYLSDLPHMVQIVCQDSTQPVPHIRIRAPFPLPLLDESRVFIDNLNKFEYPDAQNEIESVSTMYDQNMIVQEEKDGHNQEAQSVRIIVAVKPQRVPLSCPKQCLSSTTSIEEFLVTSKAHQLKQSVHDALQALFHSEYVLMGEYIEFMLPLLYALYLAVLFHLPIAAYYPHTSTMTTNKLQGTLVSILAFSAVEFVAFIGLLLMLKRKFGFTPLYQLAFVLETQVNTLQGHLFVWTPFILQLTLVHYGVDFSFRFA